MYKREGASSAKCLQAVMVYSLEHVFGGWCESVCFHASHTKKTLCKFTFSKRVNIGHVVCRFSCACVFHVFFCPSLLVATLVVWCGKQKILSRRNRRESKTDNHRRIYVHGLCSLFDVRGHVVNVSTVLGHAHRTHIFIQNYMNIHSYVNFTIVSFEFQTHTNILVYVHVYLVKDVCLSQFQEVFVFVETHVQGLPSK